MDYFLIASILVLLSAVFGYINVRFLKLPNSIGLMLITILFTLGIFAISYFDDTLLNAEKYIITQIDFKTLLLDVMLGFLLFAGALHTNFEQLKVQRCGLHFFSGDIYVLFARIDPNRGGLYLLPCVRGLDFTYRSDCRFGNPKKSRCT